MQSTVTGDVQVKGLTRQEVENPEAMAHILRKGNSQR